MTVWILNPFDNLPLEGYRPQRYWLMARAFAQAGHKVTYWTSNFSHAHKAPRKLNVPNDLKNLTTTDGFRLALVPTRPYPSNICLRRIWSHRAFARTWRRMASADAERPDVVIASLPPLSSCAAALAFCRHVGARFVVDIMDAWPETFYRLAPAWLFTPLRATARRIYRAADAVTAVAARYLDLARSYGTTAPARLCHHGIDLDEWRKAKDGEPPSRHAPFTLVYLGAMGASYDLETVIDAVKGMDDVELELAGTGPKESTLRARAADCPRIRFCGYLPHEEMQALLSRAHAGVIPMFPDSCVGIPYKLADYAAAGLRVINSLPDETADLVARHAAGTFYAAGDVDSFKSAVQALRRPGPDFAPDAFRSVFDARRIYADYVDFIQTLTKQP